MFIGELTQPIIATNPTVVVSLPSTAVGSVTWLNNSASASPSNMPLRVGKTFFPGQVPSGNFVKAQIGGNDIRNQADLQVYHADGSLAYASWSLIIPSSIGANQTVQIDFVQLTGNFNNTSSGSTADVTINPNFLLSNMHPTRAKTGTNLDGLFIALNIGGGAVTSGIIKQSNLAPNNINTFPNAIATATVVDGSGTGATLALTGTAKSGSITSAGTGYASGQVLTDAGGSGLVLTISTVGGSGNVTAVTITNGGTFSALPGALSFTGGTGTSFTWTPNRYDANGINVTNGGSGYNNMGSGTWTSDWNTAIGLNQLEKFRSGPVVDAWRAWMFVQDPNTGNIPHPFIWTEFYVENWKNANGTSNRFYYKGMCKNAAYRETNFISSWPTYTYDADWRLGTTVIRGASNGDSWFDNIVHYQKTSWATSWQLGDDGDWTVDDAAIKAFIPKYAVQDKLDLKKSTLIPPIDPTQPTNYPALSFNGSRTFGSDIPIYKPMYSGSIYVPTNAAPGLRTSLGIIDYHAVGHFITQDPNFWRCSVVNSVCASVFQHSIINPATFRIPNVISAAEQSFPGLGTTTYETKSYGTGTPGTGGAISTNVPVLGLSNSSNDTTHIPQHTLYPYLIKGEYWTLRQLIHACSNALFFNDPTSTRQGTVGPRVYNGTLVNAGDNRNNSWCLRDVGAASRLIPTSMPEQAFMKYIITRNFQYMNDMQTFIGNVKIGSSGVLINKTDDWSVIGIWTPRYLQDQNSGEAETLVPFMDNFFGMAVNYCAKLLPEVADIAAFRDTMIAYIPALWAAGGCNYLKDAFRLNAFTARREVVGAAILPDWNHFGDLSTPQNAMYNLNTFLNFTAGDPIITSSNLLTYNSPVTQNIASGSLIKITDTLISSTQKTNPQSVTPTGFDQLTWNYFNNLGTTSHVANGGSIASGGTGYVVGEQITMNGGAAFIVTNVIAGGVIATDSNHSTALTQYSLGRYASAPGLLTQFSTSGSGTGFTWNATDAVYHNVEICSDPGLTTPITPSSAFGGNKVNVNFWTVLANTCPTNSSGTIGSSTAFQSGNSYLYWIIGVLKYFAATTGGNATINTALANSTAIQAAIGGSYVTDPTVNFDITY